MASAKMLAFWRSLLLISLMVMRPEAQNPNSQADSLASEAASFFTLVAGEGYSIYTELTALIGAAGSATEPATSETSSRSAAPTATTTQRSITSHSSLTRRSSLRTTSRTSSVSQTSEHASSVTTSRPPSTVAAAAASATIDGGREPPDSEPNHRLIAILVGTLVGAVVLGLLLLLAVLCFRRRSRGAEREGGVTPTSDEVRSWRSMHGNTSYAPITEFEPERNLGSEKAVGAVSGHSISIDQQAAGHHDSNMHPAYRNMNMHDLVRDRTHFALTKELGFEAADAAAIGVPPRGINPKRKRNSIPRKPVPVVLPKPGSTDAVAVGRRDYFDDAPPRDEENLVSPVSPLLRDAPPPRTTYGPPKHLRNDSRDALLADTDEPATSATRPSLERDDSFTAALPRPLRPRQSTYTAYQPGISASPYGPSPTHPAAAVIAAYRNQDRDKPEVPPRSPNRRSYEHTPSAGSSTESLDIHHRRQHGVDALSENAPMLRQRSADSPIMPPKGVTYHDFVPVRKSPRTSGAPAAAWGAVRHQGGSGRRASLDEFRQARDAGSERGKDYNALRPTRSEDAVGQAM